MSLGSSKLRYFPVCLLLALGVSGCGRMWPTQAESNGETATPAAAATQPASVAPAQTDLELKMAEIGKHQAALEEKLNGLNKLITSRREEFPAAKLWVTSDHTVYRTAVPEEYNKRLGWTVLYNGKQVLSRMAAKEMQFDPTDVLRNGAGTYTFYLTTWYNGTYLPISNVVSFYLPENPALGRDQIINSGGDEKAPEPAPSPSSSPPVVTEPQARLEQIGARLNQVEESLSEYDAFVEQQKTLPRKLSLWMDKNGVINRSVGPEEIESNISIEISGAGHLSRNVRFTTQDVPHFQGAGQYLASLHSSVSSTPVSNVLHFSFKGGDRPYGYPMAIPQIDENQ